MSSLDPRRAPTDIGEIAHAFIAPSNYSAQRTSNDVAINATGATTTAKRNGAQNSRVGDNLSIVLSLARYIGTVGTVIRIGRIEAIDIRATGDRHGSSRHNSSSRSRIFIGLNLNRPYQII